MKKYTVVIIIIMITLISACAGEDINSISDVPSVDVQSDLSNEVAPLEDTDDQSELSNEADSLEDTDDLYETKPHSIIGEWSMIKNTYSSELDSSETLEDNEQPVMQTMHIFADSTFHLVFHNHGEVEGYLLHAENNEYIIDGFFVTNEMGGKERRDDKKWLRYDPESDLLRLSSFFTEDQNYIHTYYEQVS